MNSTALILVILGSAIILVLAAYTIYLYSKIRTLKKEQEDAEVAAAVKIKDFQNELIQDIRFIARAVLEEQCEITEGVMRIHYLVAKLDPDAWNNDSLTVTRKHYSATAKMPILDAYKALNKQEQFKLDNERYRLENENKQAIHNEFKWLISYDFPAVTLLH